MRSVRSRLLWSFVAVAVVSAAVFSVAVRVMVPRLFDDRVGRGPETGRAQGNPSQRDAVVSAVNTAVLVALGVSAVVAAVIAVWFSRREVRHLDELREATRALAGGDYDVRATPPPERELAALADDVNHLATALAATERRRAALVNDVAHELRTPLATISGIVEGYRDGLFTVEELVGTVTSESERLARLTQDLADVSRAEERQLPLDRQDADLAEIAETTAVRLHARSVAAGVALTVEAPSPVPVSVDHGRIVEAVTNLVVNALTYTPKGGSVTVRTGTDHGTARLDVIDTGRGLRPEDLTRVFERFYRGDAPTHGGGTGIGLTIARSIARAHGGDLVVASPGPGLGATFTLTLPIAAAPELPIP